MSLDETRIQHVFIIGSKSIGQYGGYETFVDKLTQQHKDDKEIKYHIACKANGDGFMDESKLSGVEVLKKNKNGEVVEFTYHNAHVFIYGIRSPGFSRDLHSPSESNRKGRGPGK